MFPFARVPCGVPIFDPQPFDTVKLAKRPDRTMSVATKIDFVTRIFASLGS